MPARKKKKLKRIEKLTEVYRRVIKKFGTKGTPKIRGKSWFKWHCRKRAFGVDILQISDCSLNLYSVTRVYICSECFSFLDLSEEK